MVSDFKPGDGIWLRTTYHNNAWAERAHVFCDPSTMIPHSDELPAVACLLCERPGLMDTLAQIERWIRIRHWRGSVDPMPPDDLIALIAALRLGGNRPSEEEDSNELG